MIAFLTMLFLKHTGQVTRQTEKMLPVLDGKINSMNELINQLNQSKIITVAIEKETGKDNPSIEDLRNYQVKNEDEEKSLGK